MNFQSILKNIGSKLGNEPRSFNLIDRLTWFKQDIPQWDWQDDAISNSVYLWKDTFTRGRLSWGHIIQVNSMMFSEGTIDCPGEVLIWRDDPEQFDADRFESIAGNLFQMKGNSKEFTNNEERDFAEYLENELTRAYGIKVPQRLTDGLNLRVSTVLFQRRHLPDRIITNSLLPILYLNESPMVAVVVPHKFWPRQFLAAWRQ
ncbi:hypothetical protein [Flavihumibacter petaseus]|uniref:Uncharacterized protein n=1 Tax=Flavihumibacter petaseus NBRC 106054 TaxID=1220578 RepID=A0A0E9MYV6_9BACT|nr:hypothetical protein [Flavihumibacter petaseus]GAO42713.1 hypothetical protein FPE01S_01_17290 [Flavihumibacter petaseus NBRC 106054]